MGTPYSTAHGEQSRDFRPVRPNGVLDSRNGEDQLTDYVDKAVVSNSKHEGDAVGDATMSKTSRRHEVCDPEGPKALRSNVRTRDDDSSTTVTIDALEADQLSDVVSTVATSINEHDNETVLTASPELDVASDDSEPDTARRLSSRKRGKTWESTRCKGTQLAIKNPDDIKNLYKFKRQTLVHGGNMGTVQKATGKVTGAVRAVKFIPKALAKDKMSSVKARIAVTTTFDHPNLVGLHELFDDDNYAYLVMDYCHGGSLQERLQNDIVSEVQGAVVMQQVFRAVNYMHRQHVCHRDVRPQNILFASAAEIDASCLIKVAGFGTTCYLRRGEMLQKKVGDSCYMSPEMAIGKYDKECDLWGCGILLFQILCGGRLPFAADALTKDKTFSSRRELQDSLFSARDANVSIVARELVSLLLEVNPGARFNAVQALHHVWFKKTMPQRIPIPLVGSMIENLRVFRSLNRFEQASFQIVASLLSDTEKTNCQRLFLCLDSDGNGKVTPSGLQRHLAMDASLSAAYPDISEVFWHHDLSDRVRKKAFSYTEFVAATFDRQQCLTEEMCRIAFRCFDKDGDGAISMSELSAGHLLGDMSLEELGMTFDDVDTNGDRLIDFQEFMAMMKRSLK